MKTVRFVRSDRVASQGLFPSPYGAKESKLFLKDYESLDANDVSIPLRGKRIKTGEIPTIDGTYYTVSIPLRGKRIKTAVLILQDEYSQCFHPLTGQKNQNSGVNFTR